MTNRYNRGALYVGVSNQQAWVGARVESEARQWREVSSVRYQCESERDQYETDCGYTVYPGEVDEYLGFVKSSEV